MRRQLSRILPAVHCALAGFTAFAILAASLGDAAEARSRRHRTEHAGNARYQPPYAAIVVDANSGRVLHAANPDNLRHPASITKIMTLYLLFEQLEAGKLKLDSRLTASAHAAAQEPSKLGLEPGQTIATEDAIKAVVTKSANDVAVVIAEAIAGNEADFATLMTRKAHALGMTRTVYTNASGLPDDEQVTTARDQALLGRAIQDRFPRYYRYFATSSFHFHGMDVRNHNHLLGRIQGVDGIKTGYTRASGFNLVSSVRRGGRHIVAVVFGGSSGSARDARMRDLIEEHIAEASTQRSVVPIAEAIEPEPVRAKARVASADPVARAAADPVARLAAEEPVARIASGEPAPKARPNAAVVPGAAAAVPRPGSAEPIQPIPVKTISVRSRVIQSTALAPLVTSAPQANVPPPWAATEQTLATATLRPGEVETPAAATVAPARAQSTEPAPLPPALPPPPGARPGILGTLPAHLVATQGETFAASTPASQPSAPAPHAAPRSGWMIQLGAFADESEAKQRLRSAQSMAHELLARADGFTERVIKGSKELYRARFAGFDKEKAEAACHYFKRNDIACMTLKN
jgi:D-alanyl-D-alanine carboxypeptidase